MNLCHSVTEYGDSDEKGLFQKFSVVSMVLSGFSSRLFCHALQNVTLYHVDNVLHCPVCLVGKLQGVQKRPCDVLHVNV